MGILITILLGGLIGWLASLLTDRDARQGIVGNIVVGIIGAFIGGWVSQLLTDTDRSALQFDIQSLIWALVGAVVLSWLLNWVQSRG